MNPSDFLKEALALQKELVTKRRFLHTHPHTGFDQRETLTFLQDELRQMGYLPKTYGKAGLIAICGDSSKGKTILLRADMDALSIQEEADIDFKASNGNMHACGHDTHTTMLLGAANLLKQHEKELKGQIVLCFQPAEELLEGAKDMIASGLLEDTTPDAALMLHITPGMPFDTGSVIVCNGGVSAPAADYFRIDIQGKGCHGAMPQLGIDPITIASSIVTSLQEIHARELSLFEEAVLTIGVFQAGNSANVIPDSALLRGTLRAFDDNVRNLLKKRMEEILTGISSAFRGEADLTFTAGCPTLMNDDALSKDISSYMRELLGPKMAFTKDELTSISGNSKSAKTTGSEDFAYFSHEVPSVMLAIAGGKTKDGYIYPLHHPKVTFDEDVLSYGSAVYAYSGIRWLEDHSSITVA